MSFKLLFLICSALALGDMDTHKRILLHDDQDFVAEFVKWRAAVIDLQTENQQLKTKQQQLESEQQQCIADQQQLKTKQQQLETQQQDVQTKQRQLQSAIDQLTIATNGKLV